MAALHGPSWKQLEMLAGRLQLCLPKLHAYQEKERGRFYWGKALDCSGLEKGRGCLCPGMEHGYHRLIRLF